MPVVSVAGIRFTSTDCAGVRTGHITSSERRRSMSLFPSFAWFEWGDAFFNVIDTPGSEVVAQDRRLACARADQFDSTRRMLDGIIRTILGTD